MLGVRRNAPPLAGPSIFAKAGMASRLAQRQNRPRDAPALEASGSYRRYLRTFRLAILNTRTGPSGVVGPQLPSAVHLSMLRIQCQRAAAWLASAIPIPSAGPKCASFARARAQEFRSRPRTPPPAPVPHSACIHEPAKRRILCDREQGGAALPALASANEFWTPAYQDPLHHLVWRKSLRMGFT